MATIVHNTVSSFTSGQINETELTGTDDLVLTGTANRLFIRNATVGSVTITIHGAGSTGSKNCPGGGVIDLTQDVSITVPAGQIHSLDLQSVVDFLRGAITVGGGASSVFAYILD